MNNAEQLYPLLAFFIGGFSAILDLLQTFNGRTLRHAVGWALIYSAFAGLVAWLVFVMLLGVNVSVGSLEANPLVKAIVSGLLFRPLIQSRLFMLKTKELEEPNYGPAATYERLSNVIKKQISLSGVVSNLEIMSGYLDSNLADLKLKATSLIYAHEMWTNEEKNNQVAALDAELDALSAIETKKIRLALFLQQHGGANLDLVARFKKKLETLPKEKLLDIGETVSKSLTDLRKKDYFLEQLHHPNARIQTLRKLIVAYCYDTKIMEEVITNRAL